MDLEVVSKSVRLEHAADGSAPIYAMWRNTSKVLDASAFRVLVSG
jgi:hypothetical protein